MVAAIACIAFGVLLVASACARIADGAAARQALATYGVIGERPQRITWVELIVAELVLGAAVGAGLGIAAWAAAMLALVLFAAQLAILAQGGRGLPSAAFGAHGRVGPRGVATTGAVALGFVALPFLPERALSTEQWLGIGLGFALVGVVGLALALLALARTVQQLRGQQPRTAPLTLDSPHEGPEIGARSRLIQAFGALAPEQLALAVFADERMLMAPPLADALDVLARHPLIALRELEESHDAEAWALADVPGGPYAVALDIDGTVLAKGRVAGGEQLEALLHTAEQRRRSLGVS